MTSPPPKPKRRRWRWLAVGIVCITLVAVLWNLKQRQANAEWVKSADKLQALDYDGGSVTGRLLLAGNSQEGRAIASLVKDFRGLPDINSYAPDLLVKNEAGSLTWSGGRVVLNCGRFQSSRPVSEADSRLRTDIKARIRQFSPQPSE